MYQQKYVIVFEWSIKCHTLIQYLVDCTLLTVQHQAVVSTLFKIYFSQLTVIENRVCVVNCCCLGQHI